MCKDCLTNCIIFADFILCGRSCDKGLILRAQRSPNQALTFGILFSILFSVVLIKHSNLFQVEDLLLQEDLNVFI